MFKSSKYLTYFIITTFLLLKPMLANSESIETVDYSIISDTNFQDVKRSVDVRLKNKVSIDTLGEIAKQIHSDQKKDFYRTFITYYLQGMEVGSGAWATSHFNPELEVKILGLTSKEETRNIQKTKNTSRNVLGVWRDDRPYVGAVVTIYREQSKLYLESKYGDGSSTIKEMDEIKHKDGIKLSEKGGNSHGEYFILDQQDNLKAGGRNGVFLVYRKNN